MPSFDEQLMINIGTVGFVISLLLLALFVYRRTSRKARQKRAASARKPRLMTSARNLLLILLLLTSSFAALMTGLFLRAYQAFTYENPVAQVIVQPTADPTTSRVELIQFSQKPPLNRSIFLVHGDQWMLEGDILKWDNWLSMVGLHTRYRLTRLRGRYRLTDDELQRPRSVYALDNRENHWGWRLLYDYGHYLPLVSTAFGNAVFQNAGEPRRFLVFVGNSGFIVREEESPTGSISTGS